MRPRIKPLEQRIYEKKRELALIIKDELRCSLTKAFKHVEFNLEYKRLSS